MIQINDDFYEDLTPESVVTLIRALKTNAANAGEANVEHITGDNKRVLGEGIPSPGPTSGRKDCENSAGLTSLTSEPWSTEVFRKDL